MQSGFEILSILSFQSERWVVVNIDGLWNVSTMLMMFLALINLQVAFSADRYWAICHPMKYFMCSNKRYRKWLILLCIVLGAAMGCLHLFGWNGCSEECGIYELSDSYKVSFFLWTFISTFAIFTLNGLIIFSIIKHVSCANFQLIDLSYRRSHFKGCKAEEVILRKWHFQCIFDQKVQAREEHGGDDGVGDFDILSLLDSDCVAFPGWSNFWRCFVLWGHFELNICRRFGLLGPMH